MLDNWDRSFSNCVPIGFRLRLTLPERWVRFHSLPESKRYAENEREYAEILLRHNAVLRDLSGGESRIVLLTTGYSDSPDPIRHYADLNSFDPNAVPWRTIALHEIDEDFERPSYWHLWASEWDWQPGVLDPLARLVADDVVANVLIVAPDCRWLLHPYDGGMDVIADSVEARDLLFNKHSAWLSAHPQGL